MRLEIHEAASIFPELAGEDFDQLVEDIRANGLRQSITTWQGKVIDGRNRYRACEVAGVEPRFEEWDGKGSLVDFVISANLHRRHLSASQKAAVAVDVLPLYEREAKARQVEAGKSYGENHPKELVADLPQAPTASSRARVAVDMVQPAKARDKAAAAVGASARNVQAAKKLKAEAPEVFEKIKTGEMNIHQAQRQIREDVREARRQENRAKIEEAKAPEEISGCFSTIVIDPPWDWGDEGDVNQLGRAKPDYATMPIEQIAALPVADLADDDCHLYAWVTNRSMPKVFRLLDAWGFRYVTLLTWPKPSFGMGNYFRGQTEHVVFGVKGSMMLKTKSASTLLPSWTRGAGHSAKPAEFFEFVEQCSPGPYLEMFSRTDRDGWATWGESTVRAAS